jgi:hypothetical protein
MLFVYTDASKEEEGAARVVDHATDLCSWARVNDAMFKAVERGRRWCDERRDGGGVAVADSTSTTMIHSSNGNPMATGSDLGLAFFYFLKIDFLCRLLTADTKNRLFFVQ